MCEWYHFVIKKLLIIAGIETNPGPRKKRQSITKRPYNNKKKILERSKTNDNKNGEENTVKHNVQKRKQNDADSCILDKPTKKLKTNHEEKQTGSIFRNKNDKINEEQQNEKSEKNIHKRNAPSRNISLKACGKSKPNTENQNDLQNTHEVNAIETPSRNTRKNKPKESKAETPAENIVQETYKRNTNYKHCADTVLNISQSGSKSIDGKEYICHTCDKAIRSGRIPSQSVGNELHLEDIPEDLQELSPLEERMISKRLPFMQIVNLPRGGQKGIKGSVVNVPSNISTITSILPRLPSNCGLVPVKLKRKLKYKGHSMYQSIRPENVFRALKYLKNANHNYEDIKVDDEWIQHCKDENEELYKQIFECVPQWENDYLSDESDNNEISNLDAKNKKIDSSQAQHDKEYDNVNTSKKNEEHEQSTDEDEENDSLRGLPFNTCLQPRNDPILEKNQDIFNIAPGEGQIPIDMISDKNSEILAFPREFPSGKFGLHSNRPTKIYPKRYFNQRLLNKDNRFASNIEYIFFAQYYTEVKQIRDNISIALRKGSSNKEQKTAGKLKNPENIKKILNQNEGFSFLQSVRGSYPYWCKTLHDLFAMVRQLDIPTFFCTFSAADLRWPETIQIVAEQYGHSFSTQDVKNMSWQERCFWIRTNPVTVARQFEHRTNLFINDVIRSEAAPIGKVQDFFIRVEFQQRGSPHIHCLFWIDNAPKIDKNTEEEVCSFINKYISCKLDHENEYVDLQKHCHSSSCKKKDATCRFSFPRPPSSKTLIAKKPNSNTNKITELTKRKEANKSILSRVYAILQTNPNLTFNELLTKSEVTENCYLQALRETSSKITIILERNPSECFINNYNPDLLSIWKANMDIQYVTDPWACAMYILSYISKGEREMGRLLKEASKESENNDDIRHQLKKLGNVFLTHREVSAQEAVYRVLSMPLKKTSRQVVFINTSIPNERIHILKSKVQLEQLDVDSDDVFQKGLLERYAARPLSLENMTLSDFGSMYQTKYTPANNEEDISEENEEQSEKQSKTITLLNAMGTMRKRKKRAIIRYPRFSKQKHPEKFFHSVLMLYVPWRNEEDDLLKPYRSYEDHFTQKQDEIIRNIELFEKESGLLDSALQILRCEDLRPSEWDKLASTTEQEQSDCKEEGTEFDDLAFNALNLRKSPKTREIPKPFHLFVTGGAGTGKSHLINAIVNMAKRELQTLCDDNPEGTTVLLMAPTGCAAKNIKGNTIHSALSIPVSNRKNSVLLPLSANKLATMRFFLQHLKIIIIDEISMVGYSLLNDIHLRLQDIMGTDSTTYFGGVSVLAVGDFYQLQPVGCKHIFASPSNAFSKLSLHLWKDLFKFGEITEIMRQKSDISFANILNRIRLGNIKDDDLNELQKHVLSPDVDYYPRDALHVFPLNRQVDEHNLSMLQNLNQPIHFLHAKGPQKDVTTGRINVTESNEHEQGKLQDLFAVATGARVMLIRNVDLSDSLVNGVMGTVTGFIKDTKIDEVKFILVKFDDPLVGKQRRKNFKMSFGDSTPIEREQTIFTTGKHNNVEHLKTQFPLNLSFACTIHKTQGMTTDKIVISFDGPYRPGQAYVALKSWLSKEDKDEVLDIPGFHLFRTDRGDSYRNHECSDEVCKKCNHKGVIPIYYSDHDAIYCCIPKKESSVPPQGKICIINNEQNRFSKIIKPADTTTTTNLTKKTNENGK
ncbi:uncharacterized protein LOC134269784, partial [Saccostrea cucullata]|uniref:uncharacterized protein LOC134269784 n=1 Tax=Saccostrea cuccullata TaxID=36930 RepID=UPI002ED2CEDD